MARKHDSHARRSPGRPRTAEAVRALILRMTAENRTRGCARMAGALKDLGHETGRGTTAEVLREAGVDPAPDGQERTTWHPLGSRDMSHVQGENGVRVISQLNDDSVPC